MIGLLLLGTLAHAADGEVTVWAGQQVTEAVRQVPILGAIHTRTTIRTVARVVEQDGAIVLFDRPCHIDVHSAGGVQLDFDPVAVQRMPIAITRFEPEGDGYVAGPWPAGWGALDVDQDGRPGLQVGVRASVCSGWLDIASSTESRATGRREGGALAGTVEVRIDRHILAAGNPCLGLVKKHTEEEVTGHWRFVPVAPDATCESLDRDGWPHDRLSTSD